MLDLILGGLCLFYDTLDGVISLLIDGDLLVCPSIRLCIELHSYLFICLLSMITAVKNKQKKTNKHEHFYINMYLFVCLFFTDKWATGKY